MWTLTFPSLLHARSKASSGCVPLMVWKVPCRPAANWFSYAHVFISVSARSEQRASIIAYADYGCGSAVQMPPSQHRNSQMSLLPGNSWHFGDQTECKRRRSANLIFTLKVAKINWPRVKKKKKKWIHLVESVCGQQTWRLIVCQWVPNWPLTWCRSHQ